MTGDREQESNAEGARSGAGEDSPDDAGDTKPLSLSSLLEKKIFFFDAVPGYATVPGHLVISVIQYCREIKIL